MPQSLSSLLIHLIFSTKDRYPFLSQKDLLSRTHAYVGGILRDSGSPSITIGGTADHVHAFFRLSRTQQMSKLVETLKSHSSRWLKCAKELGASLGNEATAAFRSASRKPQRSYSTLRIKRSIIVASAFKKNFVKLYAVTRSLSTNATSGTKLTS